MIILLLMLDEKNLDTARSLWAGVFIALNNLQTWQFEQNSSETVRFLRTCQALTTVYLLFTTLWYNTLWRKIQKRRTVRLFANSRRWLVQLPAELMPRMYKRRLYIRALSHKESPDQYNYVQLR